MSFARLYITLIGREVNQGLCFQHPDFRAVFGGDPDRDIGRLCRCEDTGLLKVVESGERECRGGFGVQVEAGHRRPPQVPNRWRM